MSNPFEKDWTKPEGHEIYATKDPNLGTIRDVVFPAGGEPISPGTSGGAAFTLGNDGLPQIVDTTDWTPGSLSAASGQRQVDLLKWILETLPPPSPMVGVGGHYYPQRCEVLPSGNH